MIALRPYQNNAIAASHNFFKAGGKHAILQAPTGAGKTVIFSELSRLVSIKSKRVLIMTDRTELLLQAGGSLKRIGLYSFYIQAGCKVVSNAFNCYIGMSQTLRNRMDKQYWIDFINSIDLFIFDECHKQEFNYLFESGLLDDKHVLGFTATPKRSGKMRQLGLDYETIIPTVEVQELIDLGYLVNDDYYGIESPDMSNVAFDPMKGDFQEKQMFQKFNSPKLYAGVVDNWQKLTPNTKTLCFCVNIEHCIKTALEFKKQGISAKFLVSSVSKPKKPDDIDDLGKMARYEERLRVYNLYADNVESDRRKILEDFHNGEFTVLINAGILTTGYDESTIETVILNRATASVALLLQMLGRGSRINPPHKTHFNVLDFGGNCGRLGHYSEPRLWSLWHEKNDGQGLPPVKDCGFTAEGTPIMNGDKKGCRRLIPASSDICPICGFKYPEKKFDDIDLENIMFDVASQKAVKSKRIKDMDFEELHDYWKSKKHKPAWLWRQLWYKGRENAMRNFGHKYGWSSVTVDKAIKFCNNF